MVLCASCCGQGVGDVIAAINSKKSNDEVFKVSILREYSGLTAEDYESFMTYLKTERVCTRKDIVGKLKYLSHRRLAVWHIDSAPPEQISPNIGMFHHTNNIRTKYFFPQIKKKR